MDVNATQEKSYVAHQFLAGGGEMGELILNYDWAKTSIGPIDTWPQSLRTCIRIMLTSRQPFWIGWGKELIKLYNDPYKAILGGKHPWALGEPASVVWKDIWKDIDPMLRQVMEKDKGTYAESQLLIMERNGYPEETYYTFSYTPIPGDNGDTAGMICANSDDTDRIISERQLTTLTMLGQNLTDCRTNEDIIDHTIQSLKTNPYDFPFALFYTLANNKAQLKKSTELAQSTELVPNEIDLDIENEITQLLKSAAEKRTLQILEGVTEKMGEMPKGAWQVAPDKVVIIPIFQAGVKDPFGYLVAGANPYHLLDEKYKSFYTLAADQITTSVSNVHALDEERKRATALAEIDKAKTAFFSNISHEFRTPLTLLLGPIEDALNDPHTIGENRMRMDVAFRNGLRMQKLVNTLLEFSRIEAGRLEGKFQPVNISAYTEDLTSLFRSAIEKAGMRLIYTSDSIGEPIYLDTEMWEKIVLNLISNAFKYSREGTIEVSIKRGKGNVKLVVTDTGTGIPEDQLEKIFDRFHRVENSGGRSQEGTGIGLALVKELVKLHSGKIEVTSELNKGSAFTITIPTGTAHLPADKVIKHETKADYSDSSAAFVEEALKWIPSPGEGTDTAQLAGQNETSQYTVLLADDNADMRTYVQRLLAEDYRVILAKNGAEAFEQALQYRPDLILSDIMMPGVDGFEFLSMIRRNNELKNTPFIFLSARAGAEAKVEGLNAGADDYLVKPFSAKELLVRVSNLIKMNQVRRETEQKFYQLFLQAPALIHVMKGPEHVFEFFHPSGRSMVGGRDLTGMTIREALPEYEGQGYFELLDQVYRTGDPVIQNEMLSILRDEHGEMIERYFNFVYQPWRNERNEVQGILNMAIDVTEAVMSKMKIEESEKRFRNLVREASVGIIVVMGEHYVTEVVNDAYCTLINHSLDEVMGRELFTVVSEGEETFRPILDKVRTEGIPIYLYDQEYFFYVNDKKRNGYLNLVYQPYKNEYGSITGVMVLCQDVTAVVEARKKIEESETRFRLLAETLPQLVWVTDEKGEIEYLSSSWNRYTGLPSINLDHWHDIIHPDDEPKMAAAWSESRANRTPYTVELRLKDKSGRYRWFSTQGTPIRNKTDRIIRWVGAFTDIDDQKNIEDRLEKLVDERTTALGRSNTDLQQFAHVASHDLKEPTRKIKLFIERVVDDKDTILSEKSKTFIEKVRGATDRMFAMIDGVLNYSTINGSEENIQQVNLNEIMRSITTDLEVLINQKQAAITYAGLPVIEGASILLYQLFYNLVTNSLKFSRPDVPPVINITCQSLQKANKDYAVLELTDNGIGFDSTEADRIFGTFARLNPKDKYEGTGLGLSLCKKIAERHHGSIKASGERNHGAKFIITLPVLQHQNQI
jgi:PAS domain S-box-containing protein